MAVRCPACARMVSEEAGYCPRCGSSLTIPLRLAWLVRLFWACPACGSETPLTYRQPFFGAPSLACSACRVTWRLDRESAALTLYDPAGRAPRQTRPLAEWLAMLPEPCSGRPLVARGLLLFPDEVCLLKADRARMLAPRQATWHTQPVGRVEVLTGIFERIARDPLGPSPAQLATVAHGPFFVTDRRVVFMGNRKQVEVPLARLLSVEVDEGYLLLHRASRTDTFDLQSESAVRVRAAILAIQDGGTDPVAATAAANQVSGHARASDESDEREAPPAARLRPGIAAQTPVDSAAQS